jgi:hypothetical protein
MVNQIDQRGVREQFGPMQIVVRHQRQPAEVIFVYGRQMNQESTVTLFIRIVRPLTKGSAGGLDIRLHP